MSCCLFLRPKCVQVTSTLLIRIDIIIMNKLRRCFNPDQLSLTLFLATSGGGCTPFISKLLNSLEANVFLRWMLMKPDDIIKHHVNKCRKVMNDTNSNCGFLTWSCDLCLVDELVLWETLDDLLGYFSGVHFQPL